MLERLATRAGMTAIAFLIAAGAYLSAPAQPRAQSSDCGANDGNVCWMTQECTTFLFYKICTTRYKYYPGGKVEPIR